MLSYAAMHGFNHLPLKVKIYLAYCMFRYKISYTLLVHYWNKYVGAWGGKAKTYSFKGYKDNKLVKECEIGPSTSFDLRVEPNKTTLVNEDTYDTLRIRLAHIDNHENVMDYSSRIINVELSGPIELVGPSTQCLLGGQLTLFIKSKGEKGKGKVTIKMDDIVKTVDLEIK